jgi:hypothetical protein
MRDKMSTTLPHKTEYATRASSQQNTVDVCVRESERERESFKHLQHLHHAGGL